MEGEPLSRYLSRMNSLMDRLIEIFPARKARLHAKCVYVQMPEKDRIPSAAFSSGNEELIVVAGVRENNESAVRGESVWVRHPVHIAADVLVQMLLRTDASVSGRTNHNGVTKRVGQSPEQAKPLSSAYDKWIIQSKAERFVDLLAIVTGATHAQAEEQLRSALAIDHIWNAEAELPSILMYRHGGWSTLKENYAVLPWLYVIDTRTQLDSLWTIPQLAEEGSGGEKAIQRHFSLLRTEMAKMEAAFYS